MHESRLGFVYHVWVPKVVCGLFNEYSLPTSQPSNSDQSSKNGGQDTVSVYRYLLRRRGYDFLSVSENFQLHCILLYKRFSFSQRNAVASLIVYCNWNLIAGDLCTVDYGLYTSVCTLSTDSGRQFYTVKAVYFWLLCRSPILHSHFPFSVYTQTIWNFRGPSVATT